MAGKLLHVNKPNTQHDRRCMTAIAPPLQGTTTMLLVDIPHFRELLIASFECPECGFRSVAQPKLQTVILCTLSCGPAAQPATHCCSGCVTRAHAGLCIDPYIPVCGCRNSEVQFAGAYGERGSRHTLKVRPAENGPQSSASAAPADQLRMPACRTAKPGVCCGNLSRASAIGAPTPPRQCCNYFAIVQVAEGRQDLLRRQIVKSNHATVTLPELQFEIPPGTQAGVITTLEGMLTDATSGLRRAALPCFTSHASSDIRFLACADMQPGLRPVLHSQAVAETRRCCRKHLQGVHCAEADVDSAPASSRRGSMRQRWAVHPDTAATTAAAPAQNASADGLGTHDAAGWRSQGLCASS